MKEVFAGVIAVQYVQQKAQYTFGPDAVGFGVVENSVIIGGVVLSECNGANVFIHIAGDGPWLCKRLAYAVFDFAFNGLGVKRITSFVNDNMPQAERLNTIVGFTREHTMVDAHPLGDTHVYRMFRHECRWIGGHKLNS